MAQLDDYGPSTYGDRIAADYDALYPAAGNPAQIAAACDRLAELAGPGPALELGIGTGRIALPLAERGVEVHGIDASQAMVDRLRAKPGGDTIPVTIGSFADFDLGTQFRLVYVIFNTFFGLLSQDDQLRGFQAAARHLRPDGAFLLEVFVPDLGRFPGGQSVRVAGIDVDRVRLEAARHDPVTQQVVAQHVWLTAAGPRLYPLRIRYAWPSELDLMARLAGLRLRHRWADWDASPFGPESAKHISVYEPA